ncbi:uncharacterized protein [Epargyreus clarus]|uniref:uncharacterized protein isoform X1 n=1 Tax=Epargyreus clarus TaxID=520877 RepID=UPI003C2D5C40
MEETPVEGLKMSIGNAIKEKVTETLRNADVLSMLQKIVATTPEDEESEEIRQKLQGVLTQYEAMPEAEKLQFAAQLKEAIATKLSMKLKDQNIDFSGVEAAIGEAVFYNLALIAGAALLLLIVVVFFGYKLYKSITDKEKKREEKKKAKQMKKKK